MDFFNNGILNIDEVHNLLKEPRDLTVEQFSLLRFYDNIKPKHIVECRKSYTAFIDYDLLPSISEFRKNVKSGGFSIGNRTIKDLNDEMSEDDFFETGIEGLKWTAIRRGKKKQQVILILKDEIMYPDDPWFGQTLEQWRELNTQS